MFSDGGLIPRKTVQPFGSGSDLGRPPPTAQNRAYAEAVKSAARSKSAGDRGDATAVVRGAGGSCWYPFGSLADEIFLVGHSRSLVDGMRIAEQIALKPLAEARDDVPPVSELLLNGLPTGKRVDGATLEGAVEWTSFYLLLLTDDVPHEEMLRVALLNAELDVVDVALIGNPYCTGSFSSLELVGSDTVKFRFIGGSPWTVQLQSARTLRLPFISEPRGVHRRFGFSRQFIIRGTPAREV